MRELLFTKDGKPIGTNNGDTGVLTGSNPKAGDRGDLPERQPGGTVKFKKGG
jgi:hypothetical protein